MNDKQKNVAIVASYVVFLGFVAYSHSQFLKALAAKKAAEPTFEERVDAMHERAIKDVARIQEEIDKGKFGSMN